MVSVKQSEAYGGLGGKKIKLLGTRLGAGLGRVCSIICSCCDWLRGSKHHPLPLALLHAPFTSIRLSATTSLHSIATRVEFKPTRSVLALTGRHGIASHSIAPGCALSIRHPLFLCCEVVCHRDPECVNRYLCEPTSSPCVQNHDREGTKPR